MVTSGDVVGIVREFGSDMYTLLYLNWITYKELLCTAQGTLLNIMQKPKWEKNLKRNRCIYI